MIQAFRDVTPRGLENYWTFDRGRTTFFRDVTKYLPVQTVYQGRLGFYLSSVALYVATYKTERKPKPCS